MFRLFLLASLFVIACNNRHDKVVDQMHAYRDSLGLYQVRLNLIDTNISNDTALTFLQKIQAQQASLNERLSYIKNIRHYQCLLDSLQLELER